MSNGEFPRVSLPGYIKTQLDQEQDMLGRLRTDMLTTLVRQEQEQLEHLCEIMLTTPGSPGISVQRIWSINGETMSCATEMRLNPDVPFGEIYYIADKGNWGIGPYGSESA